MSQQQRRNIGDVDCKQRDDTHTFIVIETLRNENTILKEENAGLREENDGLQETVARFKEELGSERRDNSLLQARVKELESGLLAIQEAFKIANEERDGNRSTTMRRQPMNDNALRPSSSTRFPTAASTGVKRTKRLSSSEESKPPGAPGETDSGISNAPIPAQSSRDAAFDDDGAGSTISHLESVDVKPAKLSPPQSEIICIDDGDEDSEDDIIILPADGCRKGRKNVRNLSSYERKQRTRELDLTYRAMVMRGNRASSGEKKTILNFMDGTWKRNKGDGKKRGLRTTPLTILVSEGNETLTVIDGDPPRVVFVETFFELNYSTGKLSVKKLWKPVPSPPPRPPSISIKRPFSDDDDDDAFSP